MNPNSHRNETPDVNRVLVVGRVKQNDGWWLEGGEWVRAEDARQIERARNEIARQFNELMDAKERIREERDQLKVLLANQAKAVVAMNEAKSNGPEGVTALPEVLRGEWTPRRCLRLGLAAEIEALCKFLNDAQASQSAGAEREAKGLNGWISPSITPDSDREVLMLMRRRGIMQERERVQIGYYSTSQAWWRPRGSNGDFSEDVQGWRELPSIPDATDRDGGTNG